MNNEELAALIQAGEAWRMDALIEQNKGILYRIARQYVGIAERNRGADIDDLYQSAALGMIEAVAEWEPERGAFLTVAAFHMRRRVREALGIRTTKQHLENIGLCSIDAPADEDGECPLVELLADPAALDPEEAACNSDMRRIVREAVAGLPADQRKAIEAAYFHDGRRSDAAAEKGMRTLRRNPNLAQLWAEYESAPYLHMTYSGWKYTQTSSVEDAAMRREQIRRQMAGLMQYYRPSETERSETKKERLETLLLSDEG